MDRCPNCGYCPHCGRSNPVPWRPAPYLPYVYPYPWPVWSISADNPGVATRTVGSSGATTTVGVLKSG